MQFFSGLHIVLYLYYFLTLSCIFTHIFKNRGGLPWSRGKAHARRLRGPRFEFRLGQIKFDLTNLEAIFRFPEKEGGP